MTGNFIDEKMNYGNKLGGGSMLYQGSKCLAVLPEDTNQVVDLLSQELPKSEIQITRSFDLQATRAVHAGCTCPHHGTEQCTCQLIVLLVYEGQNPPLTLVLEGRDGQTWVSLAMTPGEKVLPHTLDLIQTTLLPETAREILTEESADS
jgi:hypothetical protein